MIFQKPGVGSQPLSLKTMAGKEFRMKNGVEWRDYKFGKVLKKSDKLV
jgi:hypothetical protein